MECFIFLHLLFLSQSPHYTCSVCSSMSVSIIVSRMLNSFSNLTLSAVYCSVALRHHWRSVCIMVCVQCMSYLICMSSDPEPMIRVKADQQLEDIEKKYPGFMHVSSLIIQGVSVCSKLCCLIFCIGPTTFSFNLKRQ